MIIYKAENKINGKVYIGKTKNDLNIRKNQHICVSKKNGGSVFHKALRKYGEYNFKWSIIQKCITENHLNLAEMAYIELYKMKGYILYNVTNGGEGVSGYIVSEQSKLKLSERMKGNKYSLGKKQSEETRKKRSESLKGHKNNLGKKCSEETKKILSEKGKNRTEEHKQKLLNANTGRKMSEENKIKMSESKKGNTYFLGKTHSEETKKKMSESRKGFKMPQSTKDKLSKINKEKNLYKKSLLK